MYQNDTRTHELTNKVLSNVLTVWFSKDKINVLLKYICNPYSLSCNACFCNTNYVRIFFQTFAYSILWDMQFLLRNLALIGALLLVVAEARAEGRSLFAGVPSLGENKPKTYLQLAGRILLAFMFITLLRFEVSFLQVTKLIPITAQQLLVNKLFVERLNRLQFY